MHKNIHLSDSVHTPVFKRELIRFFQPSRQRNIFIDATADGGGHTKLLLDADPSVKVIAIEKDPELINYLKETMKPYIKDKRLVVRQGDYASLANIARRSSVPSVDGIVFDLGMSSWHLERSGRGFSFKKDEPLDMRFDQSMATTARDVVNRYSQEDLKRLFTRYGEERYSGRIARAIVDARQKKPITSSKDLSETVLRSVPREALRQKLHPATKVFQALRIYVNQELGKLTAALPQAFSVLKKGGRLGVISFHSLEDRIVKNSFKELSRKGGEILTIKPLIPQLDEQKENSRSRSAKLRVIEMRSL